MLVSKNLSKNYDTKKKHPKITFLKKNSQHIKDTSHMIRSAVNVIMLNNKSRSNISFSVLWKNSLADDQSGFKSA